MIDKEIEEELQKIDKEAVGEQALLHNFDLIREMA
jgi:hypothetical protein